MKSKYINVEVRPEGSLAVLSQLEIDKLKDASTSGLHSVFKKCSLAILNSHEEKDTNGNINKQLKEFDINIIQQFRGLKLDIINAPISAFVDGEMLRGLKEHLFSALRDIVYINNEIKNNKNFNFNDSSGITNAVFHILRNAGILKQIKKPDLVVCWGGHSISANEYEYTREVGYELGLRNLNVCTGCGPGAMKGPMKGAAIGHAEQRTKNNRYIGITEPGIIAAESPNAIVNRLVIMPDIEKRLEAFVRLGHGFIVFPGGVGTTEEILYLLGILLHPKNAEIPFPLFFTGPKESETYFKHIDHFIRFVLGDDVSKFYEIIIDDPKLIAKKLSARMKDIQKHRKDVTDAYYFNWHLKIAKEFQTPFKPTHSNMAKLNINKNQKKHILAANLRRAFSGIVSGNVKDDGITEIEKNGPFLINGDPNIMKRLDTLLESFVKEKRMKVSNNVNYRPCYKVVSRS